MLDETMDYLDHDMKEATVETLANIINQNKNRCIVVVLHDCVNGIFENVIDLKEITEGRYYKRLKIKYKMELSNEMIKTHLEYCTWFYMNLYDHTIYKLKLELGYNIHFHKYHENAFDLDLNKKLDNTRGIWFRINRNEKKTHILYYDAVYSDNTSIHPIYDVFNTWKELCNAYYEWTQMCEDNKREQEEEDKKKLENLLSTGDDRITTLENKIFNLEDKISDLVQL